MLLSSERLHRAGPFLHVFRQSVVFDSVSMDFPVRERTEEGPPLHVGHPSLVLYCLFFLVPNRNLFSHYVSFGFVLLFFSTARFSPPLRLDGRNFTLSQNDPFLSPLLLGVLDSVWERSVRRTFPSHFYLCSTLPICVHSFPPLCWLLPLITGTTPPHLPSRSMLPDPEIRRLRICPARLPCEVLQICVFLPLRPLDRFQTKGRSLLPNHGA